jgi:hypothetical protein
MRVLIHGHSLPGLVFGDAQSGHCYERVHVGIQSRDTAVQVVPADSESVRFLAEVDLVESRGETDFRGPCVQGRRGERFLYLTWGELPEGGTFNMFRRAKLLLRDVDAETLARASSPGWALEARLGLTDACGGPRCASVRPPGVAWQASQRSPGTKRPTREQ